MKLSMLVSQLLKGLVVSVVLAGFLSMIVVVPAQNAYADEMGLAESIVNGGDAASALEGSASGGCGSLASLSGLANLIPGWGTAAGVGLGVLGNLCGGSGGGSSSKDVNVKSDAPAAKKDSQTLLQKGLDKAAYGTLIFTIRQVTQKAVKGAFDLLANGFKGNDAMFYTEPWNQFIPNVLSSAGGYFIEGVVDGFMNVQKQDAKIDQTAADMGQLDAELAKCTPLSNDLANLCKLNVGDSCTKATAKKAECDAIKVQLNNLQNDFNNFQSQLEVRLKNTRLDQEGAVSSEAQQFMDNVICKPSADLTLKIGLGLLPGGADVRKPVCTLTEAFNNWGSLINQTGSNFSGRGWNTLSDFFDPNSTDLGITFNAQIAQQNYQAQASATELFSRLTQTPYRNVSEPVSGNIKTPGDLVGEFVHKAVTDSSQPWALTNNFGADITEILVSTIIDSLLEKVSDSLKNGVVSGTKQFGDLYSTDVFRFAGSLAARSSVTKFSAGVKYTQKDNLDLMNRLQSTAVSGNPDAATIGNGMAAALQTGMTVREALLKDTLRSNAIFGFDVYGQEPSVKDGNLPYRSLVILRKYRVVPVTWEYAALYIQKNPNSCGQENCTLQYMIERFNEKESPFYGLVDENWVLKLPATRCDLEGYGPDNTATNITKECIFDTNGDGVVNCGTSNDGGNGQFDVKVAQANRSESCVDEQTCLEDDGKGNCTQGKYGYCIQEQATWQFGVDTCEPQFNSCRVFTNVGTGGTLSALTNSIPTFSATGSSVCSSSNVGCHWLSQIQTKNPDQPWVNSPKDPGDPAKIYLNAKAEKIECDPGSVGCQLVTNETTGDDDYFKVAPPALDCSYGSKGYQRDECKPFVTQCTAAQQNCQLYNPVDGGTNVAGKNPQQCESSCSGLGVYTQTATQFDEAVPQVAFIPESAEQCSAQDAGCSEFTNLADETKRYFSDVQACEITPVDGAGAKTPTPFYTWYGSDTSGFQLSVINLKADASGAPACAPDPKGGSYTCECSKSDFETQRDNPLASSFSCREYINKAGSVFYRNSTRVIYQTEDCSQVRRSGSGEEYNVSPSHSISCSPQAVSCRRYEGTQAGNAAAVLVSTFEDGTTGGWKSNSSITPSSETPLRNGKSLKVTGTTAIDANHSNITIHNGYGYVVSFDIKGSASANVSATLEGGALKQPLSLGSATLNTAGDWQTISLSIPKTTLSTSTTVTTLHIRTGAGTTYLDNVIVREVQDVIFALSSKLNVPTSCQAAITSKGLGTQLNCKLYTNSTGNQVAFNGLGSLCPLEVVGCDAFTVKPAGKSSYQQYFVPDPDKRCNKDEQSCSAYGLPTLNADGTVARTITTDQANNTVVGAEKWTTKYYKVKDNNDPLTKAALCKSEAVDCQEFKADSVSYFFKDPGSKLCKWFPGDSTDSTARWIKKDGQCANSTLSCSTDDNCPYLADGVTHARCDTKVACTTEGQKPTFLSGYAALCNDSDNYCRAVSDPECKYNTGSNSYALGSNYGKGGVANSCKPAYYIKANPKDLANNSCAGVVNPAVGCLLFNDPLAKGSTYSAQAHYEAYSQLPRATSFADEEKRGVPANATLSGEKNTNALYKVDLDRQCKVWLACTSSIRVADDGTGKGPRDICLERRPCDKWGSTDEPCKEYVSPAAEVLKGTFTQDTVAVARTLSGIARPDFIFPALTGNQEFPTVGGHDSSFAWTENADTNASKDQDNRPVVRLSAGGTNAETVILNSCRLYPQSDSPVSWMNNDSVRWGMVTGYNDKGEILASKSVPVDACYYKDSNLDRQQGLYGYCLEPYPQGTIDGQYGRTKNADAGYQNFCLNWYPVNYVQGQSNVLGGQNTLPPYQGTKPLYYCLASTGGAKGFDANKPASTKILASYAVKTRDTSVFRFTDISGPLMLLRDTDDLIKGVSDGQDTQDDIIKNGAYLTVVDKETKRSELVVPSYPYDFPSYAEITLQSNETDKALGSRSDGITCSIHEDTDIIASEHNLQFIRLNDGLSNNSTSVRFSEIVAQYNPNQKTKDESFSVHIDCEADGKFIKLKNDGLVNVRIVSKPWGLNGAIRIDLSDSSNHFEVPLSKINNVENSQYGVKYISINGLAPGTRATCDLDSPEVWGVDERKNFESKAGLSDFMVVGANAVFHPDWGQTTWINILKNYRGGDQRKDYGKYSATADNQGRLQWAITAKSNGSSNTNSTIVGTQIYCSFGEEGYEMKHVMMTAPIFRYFVKTPAVVHPLVFLTNIDSVFVRTSNTLSQVGMAITNTARTIKDKTFSVVNQLPVYHVAALNKDASPDRYEVVKPEIVLSQKKLTFSFADATADRKKSSTVSASKISNPDDFYWRAVVDESKTPRVSIDGGYVNSLFYITKDHGGGPFDKNDNGELNHDVEVAIHKDILGNLSPGTYTGTVKVYAIAPIEGMAQGVTEQSLEIALVIPNDRFITQKMVGVPLEPSPDASTVKNTFYAVVNYDHVDPTINGGRVDRTGKLLSGTAPLYAPNTTITLHLDAKATNPLFCQNGQTKARLIYSHIGEGLWYGNPLAKYASNGEIQRVFQEKPCDNQTFTLESGQGRGIEYYFVVQNVATSQISRSETLYIDVQDFSTLPTVSTGNKKATCTVDPSNTTIPFCSNDVVPTHQQLRSFAGILETPSPKNVLKIRANELSLFSSVNAVPDEKGALPKSNKVPLGFKTIVTNRSDCHVTGENSPPCCINSTTTSEFDAYGIDSVVTSNKPVPYCGKGITCGNNKAPELPWLVPKAKDDGTTGEPTRIVAGENKPSESSSYSDSDSWGSSTTTYTGPLALQTELTPALAASVNEKFLTTGSTLLTDPNNLDRRLVINSSPYDGTVAVKTRKRVQTTYTADGCSAPSDNIGDWVESIPEYGANLTVRPKMVLPETISVYSSTQLTPTASPAQTVYHWRAVVESQDPIHRRTNGDFNWLSLSPVAGMSGTSISVTVSPEAARFATPGVIYNAKVKVYATSPVEGDNYKEVTVTFGLPQARPTVTIANITNLDTYNAPDPGSDKNKLIGLEQVKGEDSVMILSEDDVSNSDTRHKLDANMFEKAIHKDQIAQIDYRIEHRTRGTLPGVDWRTTVLDSVDNNLVCASYLDASKWITGILVDPFQIPAMINAVIAHGKELFRGDGGCSKLSTDAPADSPVLSAGVTPNYAQFLKAIPSITRPVISTTDRTKFTMVANSANSQDVTSANAFAAQCQSRHDGDIGRDFAAIAPHFNKDGFIDRWDTRYCDDSGGSYFKWLGIEGGRGGERQYMFITATIYLKDYCTDIAQVVTVDGQSVPQYDTVKNAPKDANGAPIISTGVSSNDARSVVPPAGAPERWKDPIPVIQDNDMSIASTTPLSVKLPVNTTAYKGTPICMGGKNYGEACTTSSDCQGGGRCFGTPQKNSSIDEGVNALSKYFQKGYLQWTWDKVTHRYTQVTGDKAAGVYSPSGGKDPIIQTSDGKKVIPGISLVTRSNKRTLELSFNTTLDKEQKPLRKIEVYWNGKESTPQIVNYSEDDRPITSDLQRPRGEYRFVHTYTDRDAQGAQVCIVVTDNWGFTNTDTCKAAPAPEFVINNSAGDALFTPIPVGMPAPVTYEPTPYTPPAVPPAPVSPTTADFTKAQRLFDEFKNIASTLGLAADVDKLIAEAKSIMLYDNAAQAPLLSLHLDALSSGIRYAVVDNVSGSGLAKYSTTDIARFKTAVDDGMKDITRRTGLAATKTTNVSQANIIVTLDYGVFAGDNFEGQSLLNPVLVNSNRIGPYYNNKGTDATFDLQAIENFVKTSITQSNVAITPTTDANSYREIIANEIANITVRQTYNQLTYTKASLLADSIVHANSSLMITSTSNVNTFKSNNPSYFAIKAVGSYTIMRQESLGPTISDKLIKLEQNLAKQIISWGA